MKTSVIKKMVIGFCLMTISASVFSQTNNVKKITVEIHNVIVNGGTVHISVHLSEAAYKKKQPDKTFQCEPVGRVVRAEIVVPVGDCVINVYQDRNGSGKCDNNLLGIPKEPVGITNWDGKGVPGSFDRLKVGITDKTQTISINLYQL